MACCGGRRAQLNARTNGGQDRQRIHAQPAATPLQPATPANNLLLTLRYLQQESLALRSPRTGTVYHVSGARTIAVHPDDAPALLRTGLFAL